MKVQWDRNRAEVWGSRLQLGWIPVIAGGIFLAGARFDARLAQIANKAHLVKAVPAFAGIPLLGLQRLYLGQKFNPIYERIKPLENPPIPLLKRALFRQKGDTQVRMDLQGFTVEEAVTLLKQVDLRVDEVCIPENLVDPLKQHEKVLVKFLNKSAPMLKLSTWSGQVQQAGAPSFLVELFDIGFTKRKSAKYRSGVGEDSWTVDVKGDNSSRLHFIIAWRPPRLEAIRVESLNQDNLSDAVQALGHEVTLWVGNKPTHLSAEAAKKF